MRSNVSVGGKLGSLRTDVLHTAIAMFDDMQAYSRQTIGGLTPICLKEGVAVRTN